MKLEKRIYCIEGIWDCGAQEVEPSVEPILEMLSRLGQWAYARRDCATTGDLKYYLEHEWRRCRPGSVLYIAAHGTPGTISLSENHDLDMETLGSLLEGACRNCLVHFASCEVLGGNRDDVRQRVKRFLAKTGAMGVSGYSVEAGWAGTSAPAMALELMLFSSIQDERIDLANSKHVPALRRLVANLQKRFEDCEFDLYTQRDRRLQQPPAR